MSKKKKAVKKEKKKLKKTIKLQKRLESLHAEDRKVKSKCCKKYKKSENKRCKKCPCFDLLQKVA